MYRNKWYINFIVFMVKLTGIPMAYLLFKPRIYRLYKGRLPKNCIFVSNHTSLFDFALYLLIFPFRTIRFLMAEVLFNNRKLLSWFLYSVGGIRVDRDSKNFSFVSDALEVLDKGGTLGIFPEGRLPVNGKPFPFTVSTAFIASHTDVPIVPIYTQGKYGFFKRAKVVIGEPVYFSDLCKDTNEKEKLQAATERLQKTVYDLAKQIDPKRKARLWNFKRFPMDMAKLVYLPSALLFRIKRRTPDGKRIKGFLRGGALIAANHISFADPFIVGVTYWYRRMFFLVAEAVMVGKLRVALLTGAGAIKINRYETDIDAIKRSVQILKEGQLLAVFPQGSIRKDEDSDMTSVKSGVILLALQADVPIIPMHICPKKHWYSRYVVIVGDPIYPRDYCTKKIPSTGDIQKITNVLLEEMNRCVPHQPEGNP